MFRHRRHKASSALKKAASQAVEKLDHAVQHLDHAVERMDDAVKHFGHDAERLAALAPESVGNEIIKHASIHLTVALLQQAIANQVSFESATTAQRPAASKSIWEILKELTSNADNWTSSDSIIIKVTGSQTSLAQSDNASDLVFTIDVTKAQDSENMFSVEILDISSTNAEENIPEIMTSPLILKAENNSLIPVTEHCEMRGRFLFDYQADACIKFGESLRDGKTKCFFDFGAGSGKGSMLAALLSWLQYTVGLHTNFVCILPSVELADQFSKNDVRNSDAGLYDSVAISSRVTNMDAWNKLCKSSGQLLIIDRSDKEYKKKLKAALSSAAMVFIDEAHEIESAKEWALIQESNCVLAVSGTPSQAMTRSFNNDDPVAVFSTNEAIRRKKVRGLELKDLGNSVPNDRLFLDAYLNYIGMTHVDTDINARLFAVAQKSFVFCLDTPAEAQKILDQLNGFAIRDPKSNQAERTKLQLNLMGAKKTVDEKAHKLIRNIYTPETAHKRVDKWDEENPDRSVNIRDFAADIQYAQKEQLAATINAIAMQALFPIPNKGFDCYQEQIVSRKFKQTLAGKDAELAILRKWAREKNAVKKAAILKKNPCIQTLAQVANNDEKSISESINAMIAGSALPEEYKYTLQEACNKTARKIHDVLLQEQGSLGDALIKGDEIDLDIFGARYAELVLEDMSDAEASEKLALLNYGFTMNLISQGLHADKLKFSTGTSIPSVLGVIVAGGSQSDVLSNPKIIAQMLARGIRGPNGACFMAIATNTHGQRPIVEISDLTPLQPSISGVSREAYRRSDKLAERREAFLSTKQLFSSAQILRRVKSEADAAAPAPDPSRCFVKQKTEELVQRFRAYTSPARVTSPESDVTTETDALRGSMQVTMMLEQLSLKNSTGQVAIDVDSSYSDAEDEESNDRTSLKNSR